MKANVYAKPEALNSLIEQRGLTLSDLADRAGVTRHTVRNALDGRPVSGGFVAGICLALGVDFGAAFTVRKVDGAAAA